MPIIMIAPFMPKIIAAPVLDPRAVMPSGRDSKHTGHNGATNPSIPFEAEGAAITTGPNYVGAHIPIGGCLASFADQWDETTSDGWIRRMVRSGLALEFISTPPRFFICCPVSCNLERQYLMRSTIQHLLDIRAIQRLPVDQLHRGFYSILFVIPKASEWGWRAILDLK